MTVVSNTSPLNYLILTDLQHVLPALFGRVFIPGAVLQELSSSAAPRQVAEWRSNVPEWLEVREVSQIPPDLLQLGAGERETITLATSVDATLVLLDERRARSMGRARGLAVSGTLGVLDRAAERRMIVMPEALDRLQRTTFRAPPRLLSQLREKYVS